MSLYNPYALSMQCYLNAYSYQVHYYLEIIWRGINGIISNGIAMHDRYLWSPDISSCRDSNSLFTILKLMQSLLPFGNYLHINPPGNLLYGEISIRNLIEYWTLWAISNIFQGILYRYIFTIFSTMTEPAFDNTLRWIGTSNHPDSIRISLPYDHFSDLQDTMGLGKYNKYLLVWIRILIKLMNLYMHMRLFNFFLFDVPTFVRSIRLYRAVSSLDKKDKNFLRCLIYPHFLTGQWGFYFENLSLFQDRLDISLRSMYVTRIDLSQAMSRLQNAIIAVNNGHLDIITVQNYTLLNLERLPQFKILGKDYYDKDIDTSTLRKVIMRIKSLNTDQYQGNAIDYSRQFDIWYKRDDDTGLDFYEDKMYSRNRFEYLYEGYIRRVYLEDYIGKLYQGYVRGIGSLNSRRILELREVDHIVVSYLKDPTCTDFFEMNPIASTGLNNLSILVRRFLFAFRRIEFEQNDQDPYYTNNLRCSYGLDEVKQFAYMVPYIFRIDDNLSNSSFNYPSVYWSDDEQDESKMVYKYVHYVTIFKVLLGKFSDRYDFDVLIDKLVHNDPDDRWFRYLMSNNNDIFKASLKDEIPRDLDTLHLWLSSRDSDQKFLLFVYKIANIIVSLSDRFEYPSWIMYDLTINNDWARYADYFFYDWQLQTLNRIIENKKLKLFHQESESGSILKDRISKNLMALIHLTVTSFDRGVFGYQPLKRALVDEYSLDRDIFFEQGMHKNFLFLDTSNTMYVKVWFGRQYLNSFKRKVARYYNLQWYKPCNVNRFSLVELLRLKFNLKECALGRNCNAVPEYLRSEGSKWDLQVQLSYHDHITNVFLVRPHELTFVWKIQMLHYIVDRRDDVTDTTMNPDDTDEKQPSYSPLDNLTGILVNLGDDNPKDFPRSMIENFLRSAGCFLALFTQPFNLMDYADGITWDRLDGFMNGISRSNMAPLIWALDTYSDIGRSSRDHSQSKTNHDSNGGINELISLVIGNPIMNSRFIRNDDQFLNKVTHATSLIRLSNYFMPYSIQGFDRYFQPYTHDKSGTAAVYHDHYCKWYPEWLSRIIPVLDDETDDTGQVKLNRYVDYWRNDADNPISIDVLRIQSSYFDRLRKVYGDYRVKMRESGRYHDGRNKDDRLANEEREMLYFFKLYMMYTLYDRLLGMVRWFMEYSLHYDLKISSSYGEMLELSVRYLRTRNDPKRIWNSELQKHDLDKLHHHVDSYFPSSNKNDQIEDVTNDLRESLKVLGEYFSNRGNLPRDLYPDNESNVENHSEFGNILPLMPPFPDDPDSGWRNKDDMRVLTHPDYLSRWRGDLRSQGRGNGDDCEKNLFSAIGKMHDDHHERAVQMQGNYWDIPNTGNDTSVVRVIDDISVQ